MMSCADWLKPAVAFMVFESISRQCDFVLDAEGCRALADYLLAHGYADADHMPSDWAVMHALQTCSAPEYLACDVYVRDGGWC